jgi:SAM-dependent methyltransferase
MTTTEIRQQSAEALAERLVEAATVAMEMATVHLGARLGLYRELAGAESLTSAELASRAGADERYVREWLEQQAAADLLRCDNQDDGPAERRFSIPAATAEVLADRASPLYLAGLAQLSVGCLVPIDRLEEAFRTGRGVPYPEYGPHTRQGIAEMNRPMFLHELGEAWLPAVADVHERLSSAPARVADIACGEGWSSISIARAYPGATVDAFDADPASVEAARRNAREAGVGDQVRVHLADASADLTDGGYDLVTIFEAVHDMARPVEALASARRLSGGGPVIVADERVADAFTAPADVVERMMYGFSVLHCLAVGREDEHSAATGTVMRQDVMRDYAGRAGFASVEVLPIDNPFWRFYRLDG